MTVEEDDESSNRMGNRLRASELLAKTGGDFGPKGTKDDPHHQEIPPILVQIVNAPQPRRQIEDVEDAEIVGEN